MTNPTNNTPQPEPNDSSHQCWRKLKKVSLLLGAGTITLIALAYGGVRVFLVPRLPGILEAELSKILNRQIIFGEVTDFSLTRVSFAETTIPSTADDPDYVITEAIKVQYNILPLLWRRTLPLEITLVKPEIYLAENQTGKWLDTQINLKSDKPGGKSFIYFDLTANIEKAKVSLLPYKSKQINLKLDGKGKYNTKTKDEIEYRLRLLLPQRSKINLIGKSSLKTGKTKANLLIDKLSFRTIASLTDNLPISLNRGSLKANLNLDIPDLNDINKTRIRGNLILSKLQGKVEDLQQDITADSRLSFTGKEAKIEYSLASLGDLIVKISGDIDWEKGYNLAFDVLPTNVNSLAKSLKFALPIPVAGDIKAKLKLTGKIKEPLLTGTIENHQLIKLDKIAFKQIKTDFTADLNQLIIKNLQVNPLSGGEVLAQGVIETKIKQAIANKQPLNFAKMPFNFRVNSQLLPKELLAAYYKLPKNVNIGKLLAQGKIVGTLEELQANLNWSIPDGNTPYMEDISGAGNLVFVNNKFSLKNTQLRTDKGLIAINGEGDLSKQIWQADLLASQFNLTPFFASLPNSPQNAVIENGKVKLEGKLNDLALQTITGDAQLNLGVDGSQINLVSLLNAGNLQAKAEIKGLAVSKYFSNLSAPLTLRRGKVYLIANLPQLVSLIQQKSPDFSSIKANFVGDLVGETGRVNLQANLSNGFVKARADATQVSLNSYLTNLPTAVSLQAGNINLTSQLKDLITLNQTKNWQSISGDIRGLLAVAEGKVNINSLISQGKLKSNILANNLNPNLLLPKNNLNLQKNLNAKAVLTNDLAAILNNQSSVINVQEFWLKSQQQFIQAQGNLLLVNPFKKPDLTDVNLDIKLNSNLAALPLNQLIPNKLSENQYFPSKIKLKGQANLVGKLLANNLLTATNPLNNIALQGRLKLINFVLNDTVFDSVMAGTISLEPQTRLAIDLKGTQDVIYASFLPCNQPNCRFPYLPQNIAIQQGRGDKEIVATGNRQGDRFLVNLTNFPLELLGITPAEQVGIVGNIAGKTNANLDINLFTLATQGEINIQEPSLGYLQGRELIANIILDVDRGIAKLTSSSLKFGKNSEYQLFGDIDLNSGQVDAQVDIAKANIEDVFTTLQWFEISDLTRLYKTPQYSDAQAIGNFSTNTASLSLTAKLNRLWEIQQEIQKRAAEKEAAAIPNQLDIIGKYSGKILLSGTLASPQLDFTIQGENWLWHTISEFANIIPPLGLVKKEIPAIPINLITIQGEYNNGTTSIEEANLKLDEASLNLTGKFTSTQELKAEYSISNLSVDRVKNFIKIPLDASGNLNTTGKITGKLSQPQIIGSLELASPAINGVSLADDIVANYNYNKSRLIFSTITPEYLELQANIPYPTPADNQDFNLEINLGTEAIALIETLTNQQIQWIGGDGTLNLKSQGKVNFQQGLNISQLTALGNLSLTDATIKTPAFVEPLTVNGEIKLNNQLIEIEQLAGEFAKGKLTLAGVLPIMVVNRNIKNPLTLTLSDQIIQLEQLYQGEIDGKIIITGSAFSPIIGGEVSLKDGQAFIPGKLAQSTQKPENNLNIVGNKGNFPLAKQSKSAFKPQVNNLKVNLDNFRLEQSPIYKILLAGDLVLTGSLSDVNNLTADGTLELKRADVDVLSSEFQLLRTQPNLIVFEPNSSILNPYLNLKLRTEVADVRNLRLRETNQNEIPDDLSVFNRSQNIAVTLSVDGYASQIIPNLGQNPDSLCQILPNTGKLPGEAGYNTEQLNQLEKCIYAVSFNNGADRQILDSPAVELSSIPNRSKAEIISLLGGQVLALAEQLQESNEEQLLEFGLTRFVFNPIVRDILYVVDDTVIGFGQKLGLDYLRIYPTVEGVYQVNKDSTVNITYDYGFGEFVVRYETRF